MALGFTSHYTAPQTLSRQFDLNHGGVAQLPSTKTESKGANSRRAKTLRAGSRGSVVVPPRAGHGRPVGAKNLLSRSAKATLEEAFERLGGVDGLVAWGLTNKDDFYKLWSRLIPKDVQHHASEGLEELLGRLANSTDDDSDIINITPVDTVQ